MGRVRSTWYDLGLAYQRQDESTKAVSAYAKAASLDPSSVQALYNEATVVQATDPTEAVQLYRTVVLRQPDSPTALLNLGVLSLRLSHTAVARAALKQAVSYEPSLRNGLSRAELHLIESPNPAVGTKVSAPSTTTPPTTSALP